MEVLLIRHRAVRSPAVAGTRGESLPRDAVVDVAATYCSILSDLLGEGAQEKAQPGCASQRQPYTRS